MRGNIAGIIFTIAASEIKNVIGNYRKIIFTLSNQYSQKPEICFLLEF